MRKSAENARNVYGINLISRTVPGTTALYGYNGHGDVINLTSEGTVVAAYYYDEFGNHADIENYAGVFAELFTDEESTEFDNPYRYAGYEYLENADLYDLNARYYDAKIARFLSPDPYYDLGNRVIGLYEINVPDALSIILANSLYAYCVNRPNNLYDHTGLDPIPKWAIRIKYGGATDEDYAKAKLISSSGKDSAWAGSAGYIVRYAIEKANHLSSKITKLDKKGLNMIANRERSLSSVKIDDNNNITSIPIIGNDVGYFF